MCMCDCMSGFYQLTKHSLFNHVILHVHNDKGSILFFFFFFFLPVFVACPIPAKHAKREK